MGSVGAIPASAGGNDAVTCHKSASKTTCGRIKNGTYTYCEWDGNRVTCGSSPA